MSDGTTSDPRSASAQVLVEDPFDPLLGRGSAHHLSRVLRLRAGAEICATDGRGRWVMCRFDGADRIHPLAEVSQAASPVYEVTVGVALVKGQKPEVVVQKLTELGVDRIVLFAAHRSVVRWDDERSEKNLLRLRRVAEEACAQSRRLWLPQVGMGELSALSAEGAAVADMDGRAIRVTDRTLLVGPEGGWDPEELDQSQLERVSLGAHVLRAETAAITAGGLMCALRAGLVSASGS